MHGAASMQFTISQLSIQDISVHQFFNEFLAELLTILDIFHQFHECLHRDGWSGVVENHSSGGDHDGSG